MSVKNAATLLEHTDTSNKNKKIFKKGLTNNSFCDIIIIERKRGLDNEKKRQRL